MKRGFAGVGLALLVLAAWVGFRIWDELARFRSEDPLVWESAIEAFEREDREHPPPGSPIVFVGSSSIRLWTTFAEDMAPLVAVRRGFGGAKVADVLYWSDRVVTRYEPRAVVIFVGTNDLSANVGNVPKTPQQVMQVAEALVAKLREAQPGLPIYWIAAKPTLRDPGSWQRGLELNRLLVAREARDPDFHVIDANAGLSLPDGSADPRFLTFDGVHLNAAGYAAWAPPIRARLLADLGS